jgi:hypothetical protein
VARELHRLVKLWMLVPHDRTRGIGASTRASERGCGVLGIVGGAVLERPTHPSLGIIIESALSRLQVIPEVGARSRVAGTGFERTPIGASRSEDRGKTGSSWDMDFLCLLRTSLRRTIDPEGRGRPLIASLLVGSSEPWSWRGGLTAFQAARRCAAGASSAMDKPKLPRDVTSFA